MEKIASIYVNPSLKKEIKKIHSGLEKLGYSISCNGADNSDLFIALAKKAEPDMYSKLKLLISYHLEHKKPVIYVIGKNFNSSNFFSHPVIRRKNTIEDVFNELKGLN
jgi:tRNA U34 5-carboxymethylaminomethyl modifying GTPase MnmE/TrmE